MTKIVLFMVLCSGLAGNQCGVIETPKVLFEDYIPKRFNNSFHLNFT